ncbi:hypothetical protein ACSFBX_10025 [Variovorax sp. RB2P76]|uniref:hypothetical protein n=1 Tax=Variovorax sp. RB2P76 TaxID=3443736 RepID=UPI003F44EA78
MAKTITEVEVLGQFIEGVMQRAEHHANNVDEVVLPLAGAILWRKDMGQEIKVLTNVLWVHLNKTRYAFSYVHSTGEIEMREGSIQGPVKCAFTNAMTAAKVKAFFEAF